MAYKWKPNASQRKAFAERMKDESERAAYIERKHFKKSFEGFKNKSFVPTKEQHDFSFSLLLSGEQISSEQLEACNQIIFGYSNNEKVHHDFIHVVNEMRRANASKLNLL